MEVCNHSQDGVKVNSLSVLKLVLNYIVKGELQRENKLISYERAFKMLENDMYIAEIGQVVLELLSFKFESGNLLASEIFGHLR